MNSKRHILDIAALLSAAVMVGGVAWTSSRLFTTREAPAAKPVTHAARARAKARPPVPTVKRAVAEVAPVAPEPTVTSQSLAYLERRDLEPEINSRRLALGRAATPEILALLVAARPDGLMNDADREIKRRVIAELTDHREQGCGMLNEAMNALRGQPEHRADLDLVEGVALGLATASMADQVVALRAAHVEPSDEAMARAELGARKTECLVMRENL